MKNIQTIKINEGTNEERLPDFGMDFPYIASRAELDKYYEATVPWHWHPAVELFYMESGTLEYTTPNGKWVFPAGSGGLVNSNVLHMTKVGPSGDETIQLLHIFENTLKNPIGNHKDEMIDHYLRLILLQLKEITEENNMSPYLASMLEYISQHYTERITLQDIADSVSLTPSYCCYLFKKELNTTIYDVIMKERILLAQSYILERKFKLQEISSLCGFNDYSHFSKYFKKVTGFLPTEYKKSF